MQRTAGGWLPALLAALLIVVLGAAPAKAAIAWAPCGDTNDFACGHLTVPLDPSDPAQGTITLAMRRHLAPVGEAKDAVIALAGGPGQAAIPFSEHFSRMLGPILSTRDLIVFDQRGIGLSHPLSCSAFEHLAGSGASAATIGICAGQIGPSRSFYTTAYTVADIEAIRQAGGYEKLVLYGTSYGTKVAEHYAQAYPSHVEALVLDSVVTPQGPDPLRRDTFAAIPRVLRALCQGRACAPITRNPVADLAQLVRRMRRAPVRGRQIDGHGRARKRLVSSPDLVAILFEGDFNPFLRAEFPAAVRSADRGDPAALERMLRRAEGENEENEPESAVEGFDVPLYFATSCEEQQFAWQRQSSPQQRMREAVAAARGLPASTFAPFTAFDALAVSDIGDCSHWPYSTPAPEPEAAAMPGVPTLIFSGEDDLRTPTEGARALAAQIPGSQLVVVPHTGHSVLGSTIGGCPVRALRAFFAGKPIRQCDGGETAPYPSLSPVAPRRLAEVRPASGTHGVAGRTVAAVVLALRDFERQSTFEFVSRIFPQPGLAQLFDISVGGLRGGWARLDGGHLTLHRYTYVGGVSVSGRISAGRGTLHIGGRGDAHGVLRVAHGRLRGALGGERISAAATGLPH